MQHFMVPGVGTNEYRGGKGGKNGFQSCLDVR